MTGEPSRERETGGGDEVSAELQASAQGGRETGMAGESPAETEGRELGPEAEAPEEKRGRDGQEEHRNPPVGAEAREAKRNRTKRKRAKTKAKTKAKRKGAKRKAKKPSRARASAGSKRAGMNAPALCPVCDGAGRRHKASATAKCRTCSAVFRSPAAGGGGQDAVARAAEAREAFYETAFGRPNYDERGEAKGLAGEAMRGFFKITRGKPAALNGFDKDVLEVDCGLGMRLRAFQDYGWWVMGTETSATACEYARRMSLDVRPGALGAMLADGPPRPPASYGVEIRFHLVFFCGSLGRVPHARATVEKLRKVIAPGGLVCVLREPLACRGAKLDGDPSRLTLHTADSVRRMFCERGFSLVSEEFPTEGKGAGETGTFWFKSTARK